MWRNKKVIIIEILVVVMLIATLGAVAIARADDESTDKNQNDTTSFIEKVTEIYEQNTGTAIDPQELENALRQAWEQQRTEMHYQCLDKLVEEEKITQEQADELKAWLEARPNIFTDEFRQWLESRPDIMGMFGKSDRGGVIFFGKQNAKFGTGGGFRLQLHNCWSE